MKEYKSALGVSKWYRKLITRLASKAGSAQLHLLHSNSSLYSECVFR